MAFKAAFFFASALLVQTAFGQCVNDIYIGGGSAYGLGGLNGIGGLNSVGLGNVGIGSIGLGLGNNIGLGASGLSVAPSSLYITSISPIGPSGLAVASENIIEGNLLVTGQLPFLSAVGFEGALPTAGSGVATCGCGSGQVGIVSEGFGRPGIYF